VGDSMALKDRKLPPVEVDVKDFDIDGHRVTFSGRGPVSWRCGPEGLAAFAGSATTGIEVDGRRWTFTAAPARIGFAPVAPERLPQGSGPAWHLLLDAPEATLPIPIAAGAEVIAWRDAYGDGRKLEPVKVEVVKEGEGIRVKVPPELRGSQIIIVEPKGKP